MSEEAQIFVALLEEGVEVWRPVAARRLDENQFVVLGEVPDTETWQFVPGTIVRCAARTFAGGEEGLLAIEAVHG